MPTDPDSADSPPPEVSDTPTTVIAPRATPARVGPGRPTPGPRQTAATPMRVPESSAPPRRRRWPLLVVGVAVLVAGGIAATLFVRQNAARSEETSVRAAITDFATALARGDLAALRAGSCGGLAEHYATVTDTDFADVYRSTNADGGVPVLDSIDAVAVTDTTALAQVTVHTPAAPTVTSVRSFALENHDGRWKVCS